MIRGLLAKELRQNGFAFTFLLVAPVAGYVLLGGHGRLRAATGGGFEEARLLLMLFIPFASLVLNQLLIASEFRHKTQLFLEALPLPRWRMLVVKFLLGALLLAAGVACVLGLAWWQARGTSGMTPRFASLLAARTAGWVGFVYTLTFAHAFLGRYRALFAILFAFGLLLCLTLDLPLSQYGPFALIDSRFAFERFLWPAPALAITAALIAAFVAAAFTLGLVRDATLSTMLAEKMSAREKLFVSVFCFMLMIVVGEAHDRKKSSVPVLMPGASEAQRGVVRVVATAAVDAPTRAETAALETLVADLGDEFAAFTRYLRCASFPPIFIVHRRDLTGGDIIRGELAAEQGLLVRVNVLAPEFSRDALTGWLVREALIAHTHGLLERERNAWVLDAVEWWWPRSARGTQSAWTDETRRLATARLPASFDAAMLRRWFSVRHEVRPARARVLAGSALAWMAEHHGAGKTRDFLSARLGRAEPGDSRAWFRDLLRPTPARLESALGVDDEQFVAGWRAALSPPP